MTTHEIAVRILSGTITDAEVDAAVRQLHAQKYPSGCRRSGHMCEDCAKRLNDRPHRTHKVGARRGYRGWYECSECDYSDRF